MTPLLDEVRRQRAPRPRYVVTIEPANDDRPDEVRLRRLLKELGRRHGLEVIDVTQAGQYPTGRCAKAT